MTMIMVGARIIDYDYNICVSSFYVSLRLNTIYEDHRKCTSSEWKYKNVIPSTENKTFTEYNWYYTDIRNTQTLIFEIPRHCRDN